MGYNTLVARLLRAALRLIAANQIEGATTILIIALDIMAHEEKPNE